MNALLFAQALKVNDEIEFARWAKRFDILGARGQALSKTEILRSIEVMRVVETLFDTVGDSPANIKIKIQRLLANDPDELEHCRENYSAAEAQMRILTENAQRLLQQSEDMARTNGVLQIEKEQIASQLQETRRLADQQSSEIDALVERNRRCQEQLASTASNLSRCNEDLGRSTLNGTSLASRLQGAQTQLEGALMTAEEVTTRNLVRSEDMARANGVLQNEKDQLETQLRETRRVTDQQAAEIEALVERNRRCQEQLASTASNLSRCNEDLGRSALNGTSLASRLQGAQAQLEGALMTAEEVMTQNLVQSERQQDAQIRDSLSIDGKRRQIMKRMTDIIQSRDSNKFQRVVAQGVLSDIAPSIRSDGQVVAVQDLENRLETVHDSNSAMDALKEVQTYFDVSNWTKMRTRFSML